MLEVIVFWTLIGSAEVPPRDGIPVQSVVVSLIDDVDLAFGDLGVVQAVHHHPGDVVKQGDLLAQLDSIDAQLALDRVQAELEMVHLRSTNDLSIQLSEKSLAVTESELKRALGANEKFEGTVSGSEIDRLRLARDEAMLQVEQARRELQYLKLEVKLKERELAIARRQIERRELRAPVDGLIVKTNHQPGEWAQPEQPFCRLINTERVRIEGFVNVEHGSIQVGQSVRVSLTDATIEDSTQILGNISFVDPEIDTINGQYRVCAEVANPAGLLRPGGHPRMSILIRTEDQAARDATEPVIQ